jgi:hypothetical protein
MRALPVALHVGVDELPWVESPSGPGARIRR